MTWSREQEALLILSCVDGVGPITSQSLIEYFGSARAVIEASEKDLTEVVGIGHKLIAAIHNPKAHLLAREEMDILERMSDVITPIFWGERAYPKYLEGCVDAPLVLYLRGSLPTDAPMISVVGTRHMSPYAEDVLRATLKEWSALCPELVIVSGLAYGVDCTAHRVALEVGLRTIGVVAHGHYTLYPSAHRALAREMCERGGGVITEYTFNTKAIKPRFVARNRIVAGISQATLLVESPERGGSLITANVAFDYNRSVYAVPGRYFDANSMGCNRMIALNKASILTSPKDVLIDSGILSVPRQQPLPWQLEETSEESSDTPIVHLLKSVDDISVEDMAYRLGEPLSTISAELFDLELDGLVRPLPGGRYSWIRK